MELRGLYETLRAVWPVLWKALASGRLFRPQCRLTKAHPDVLFEVDVEIPLSDGTRLTANVFRSKAAAQRGEATPVVMCAHPYDNHLLPALGNTPFGGPPQQYRMIPQEGSPEFSELTSWEAPDPNFWVPAGYAVVNLNMPGFANSGGKPTLMSVHQASCFSEAIEWIAKQPWCSGAVGLNGVSYLAISQYMVAAGQGEGGVPHSLRAICPWEGVTDLYRDVVFEGGVEEQGFPVFWWYTEVKPTINCSEEEFVASEGVRPSEFTEAHPFFDEYWKAKNPDLSAIRLPMLVCASFSDQGLHTRGSFRAFRKAASEHKWVYTHRSLKWDAYYSREVLELTKRFFDCFVKGERDNGFLETPPVRLEVRSARRTIHEVRYEREWPLARTRYRRLHLRSAGAELADEAQATEGELRYDAGGGGLEVRYRFREDTELTGYMKLRLWVEARGSDDMALFVSVDKLDGAGRRMPFFGSVGNHEDAVARGLLRVSRRELDEAESTEWEPVLAHQRERKLAPGEIVPVDIAINPSSTFFRAGESLALTIAPREIVPSPPYRKSTAGNRGLHVLHVGGRHDSYLLIPVIEGRA
ncbi:MAG: CocE/NonD family hydrolase [Myxococcota bacterium]